MPELPDVVVYIEALGRRVIGQRLDRVRLASPFVVRSVSPPITALEERPVREIRRLGKRIVFVFSGDLFLVLHLMIAGRLRWESRGTRVPAKIGLGAFDFPAGTLLLTEASSKKRASLYVIEGEAALALIDPGGLEVLEADVVAFRDALLRENHTLKRALTDPRLFSGIGNAYSDEILHASRLSPAKLTRSLSEDEVARLHVVIQQTLSRWIAGLRAQFGERFPGAGEITAFRDGFAVHGRFRQPCPACGTSIQRIRYAENEANYCPKCQTGGRLLADRGLSRLLKDDWPRTIEALELQRELKASKRSAGD